VASVASSVALGSCQTEAQETARAQKKRRLAFTRFCILYGVCHTKGGVDRILRNSRAKVFQECRRGGQ